MLTVILNWRTAPMTLRAVAAARTAMAGIAGEITVVDNDSQDGSFETMAAHVAAEGWDRSHPKVRVLASGRNGGFGAGNNVGILAGLSDGSAPDFYYVLNSDAFPAPDAIARLRDHLAAHPEAGFAGSYIHGEDGEPHLTSFRFPSILSEFEGALGFGPVSRLLARHAVPVAIPETTVTLDWTAGASLMMRRDALERVGLFDESFFLYFEETDLCRRLAKAGWRVDYVRDSAVAHIGSASTGMKDWGRVPRYWFASRWHYFVKNHGRAYAAAASLAHLAGGSLHWLRCRLTGRRGGPPHFLRSLAAHDLAALVRPLSCDEPRLAAQTTIRETRPPQPETD
ncbi:MAG: glycosyltransferase family 2 protein [Paracoccaceae bacterium]